MSTAKQSSPLLETQRKQPDTKYVDLAIEMQYRANTGDREEMNQTYFIYQTGHVKGPYTVNELLAKCVRNEIHLKSEKILFCPTSITNTYYHNKNTKMWNTLLELKDTGYHDKLYTNLYPLQQTERIIQRPPSPDNQLLHKKSFGISFHQAIRISYIILSKILFVIISVHFIIPLVLCTTIYCILYIFCCSAKKLSLFSPYNLCLFIGDTLIVKDIQKNENNETLKLKDLESIDDMSGSNKIKDTHYVSIFIGFTFTPLLIIMLCDHYINDKDYIVYVCMIVYSVWCLFFIIDYFCINLNLWYKHLTKLIVGIHVTNVYKQDLLLILCALSATLPAVIIGYLADYIFDETITLICSEDTISEICTHGKCCYPVSSHDTNVANILLLFGLLRLLSWIVMKADTTIIKSSQSYLE